MSILDNYRKQHGFSYTFLGKILGVSQPTAWRLCNKPKKALSFAILEKISKLTKVSTKEIIADYQQGEANG